MTTSAASTAPRTKPTRTTARVAARIAAHRAEILALAQRHGASNVRVFGSFVHGTMTGTSDLDLLVEFEPRRSLFDHIGLNLDSFEMQVRGILSALAPDVGQFGDHVQDRLSDL